MSNPYTAPMADTPEPRNPVRLGFWLVSVSLGVAWWLALLIPEMTRELLLHGPGLDHSQVLPTTASWGLLRMIGLVVGACAAFRWVARSSPRWRWPCAAACLWLGSGLFALTIDPLHLDSSGFVLYMLFVAPLMFMVMTCYVVIPMLVISVVALSRVRQ